MPIQLIFDERERQFPKSNCSFESVVVSRGGTLAGTEKETTTTKCWTPAENEHLSLLRLHNFKRGEWGKGICQFAELPKLSLTRPHCWLAASMRLDSQIPTRVASFEKAERSALAGQLKLRS